MDFLFAPLPETNFQMTDDQLVLWQRNAIFECDCDNFINRRIEAGRESRESCQRLRQLPHLLRRPMVEQSAIDMAIEHHGLHAMDGDDDDDVVAPTAQRPRLLGPPASNVGRRQHHREMHMEFYQEAIAAVIMEHGLGLQRNP